MMRRVRSNKLTLLLLAACLLATALTQIQTTACAVTEPEQLSEEDIAEAAVLEEEAVQADPDASDIAEEVEEESVDEKDVLVLTQDTFDDAVKKNHYILVEFYAPWCGHCQALKPEYARAATALKESGSPVALAKVDATAEVELGRKFAVQGYPTLKWFVDGEPLEYSGGRTEEDILKWIKKKTGPPAQSISTSAQLEKIRAEGRTFVLGFFKAFETSEHKAFEDAARATDDVEFFQTTKADVAQAVGLSAEGVVLGSTFEGAEEVAVFDGALEKDAIKEFVKAERVPPYVIFNEENQDIIFNSGIALNIILIASAEDLEKGSLVTKAVRAAHAGAKGKAIFVLADRAGEAAEPIIDFFNLEKDAKEPQLVGFNMETSHKYLFKEAFSEKGLSAFVDGIVGGSLEPDYKSEKVPVGEDAKDGDVVVVVGKSFDEIVLDEKRDVLLEAYAPWCGHCKQLAPTYKKLAKRFRDVDSVVIAKMDATENEHANLKVEGFPTILLYPSGNNQTPIPFDGADRSLKALTQFIKKSAKTPFSLKKKSDEVEAEDKADEEEQKQAAAAEEAEDGQDFDLDGLDIGGLDVVEEDAAETEALTAEEGDQPAGADARDEL